MTYSGGIAGTSIAPVVTPRKSGPAQSSAGLTAPYSIGLTNTGKANASSVTVTDTIDGAPVDLVSLVVPPLVAVNRTEFATFSAASSPARPAGPLTDVAAITWRDIRGNLYGPVSSSFTTELAAARAEGYLFVSGGTSSPDIVGASKALTATAIDASGHPVAGVTVHFTVTGINPQTTDLTTGADGTASFVYTSAALGTDTIVASATVTTTPIQSDPVSVQWASTVGTPCTGRRTPLDIMLVVDVSPSMVLEAPKLAFGGSAGKLEAAQTAGDRFIDDLTYPLDHIGVVTFTGGIVTSAPLGTDAANVKAQLDSGIGTGILCTGIFCPGGSDVANALNVALDELESPRRRPDATKVIVYIGDGGADVDPTAAIARLRASGARALAIGLGSTFDGLMSLVREIADSPNDYFYSPSGAGIDFAFNSLNQDLCRNRAPYVSAGGDYGAYSVRLPSPLTLQGEVHDDGSDGDQRLMSEWTLLSGPATVSIVNPTSPITDVLFFEPGTYTFQLSASDGYLTVADRATITVDPDPSIVGASLAVALSAPGPLETGQAETLTATLLDGLGAPIRNFVVTATVAGANPVMTTLVTDNAGVATFTYRGAKAGTDVIHATAIGSTLHLDSANVSVQWVQPATGGPVLTQGWIGAPLHQATIMDRIPILLSPDVTLASGTVTYAPTSAPTDVHTLASNVSGAPGAVIATFDTTLVANDSYVIQLAGTDQSGNQKTSTVLVTVTGDYKPGRVVVEMTDLTVPIAGLPITIGRRYDSLEKDKVGDFGHGWSLAIGHPRVQMNPDYGVTLTLPNGRRATFGLTIAMRPEQIIAGPFNPFPGVYFPAYQAEPGVFGTLTQEGGCPAVRYNPSNPDNPIPCFFTFGFVPDNRYAPEFFTYTDPYGTAYRMAASGELKSITDRQGNRLSFEANGIISSTGRSVTWERDTEGRITKVDYAALFGPYQDAANYTYDAAGDLVKVTLAPANNAGQEIFQHTYAQHRLLTTKDPRGNTARTSTYDPDGRLQSDKDALNNETTYEYNLAARTTKTTHPDSPVKGIVMQTFDARGLLLSETDQLGHTTTHEYDANRNETKRTNALGEETIATYDDHGNQTSVTDPTGTTHTTYGDDNLPTTFTDRLGHVTTVEYDDRHVPNRIADELGTRFKFTNSEQGLPLTIDDAEGHRAYLMYDVAGNVTSRTDWLGRETRATYDEGGRRITETSARGAVSRNVYIFGFGRLGSAIQPNGYSTEHSYDANGNLLVDYDLPGPPGFHGSNNRTYNALNQITQVLHNPEQTTVTYERDFRGNPLTMTDENGHTTTYEYDLAGQLKKTTFADGTFTTRTYDDLNRLATVTDERHHPTTYQYGYQYDPVCDCTDRVETVIDPLENATKTKYDGNGRRKAVTDANNHTTRFVYDERGHVVETHYPDGTATYEVYDSRGRRTSTTDQTQATTLYGYDDQGQLTSVTDPLEVVDPGHHVTHYAYDLDGNLTSVTDANGHTTSYAYDLMKRKTKRTLPLGQFETFKYDLAGRLTDKTEFSPAGTNCSQMPSPCKTTTMTYDTRDRMLTKVPDASRGEATHVYTYWPNGLRKTAANAAGTTTYTYDERDRMLTKAETAGTLTYTFDDAGNVATIRSSNTNGTSVDYLWNEANQLVSVTDNRVGGTTSIAYTATNRPSTLAQPNGVGLTYSYDDPLDRVTSMLWRRGTSPAFASWVYTHNERGQRLTSTDVTGRAATYTYDSAARLATETITADPRGATFDGALSYVLDGGGSRLARTSTLAALGAQVFTYNANDEISGDTFDVSGNTTASGGHTFAYDFENRLISKDASAVTVQYDCDGNRVAKTVGGVTTRYLVDDLNPTGYLQVMEEIMGGAVQTRYTHGTNLVSQTRNVSSTPATRYYGYDAHGNVTFLTDAAGAVTDSYDYDAWGNLVATAGSTPNTRLFAGEEYDPDLELLNLRARQYRPGTGRFLTIDPLSGKQQAPISYNRYLYGSVDPINRKDPLGLMDTVETGVLFQIPEALLIAAKGAAIGGTAAVAGHAVACSMQERVDEFAAISKEPEPVRVVGGCPIWTCFCRAFVLEALSAQRQTPLSVKGRGRGDSPGAAISRCFQKIMEIFVQAPWNTGDESINLVEWEVTECRLE